MRNWETLLAAGFAGSLLAYPLASVARVDIDVDVAPPPVVVENAPVREGYIYAPGYWDWDDGQHRHVWHNGEYMKEQRGQHWVPYSWEQRNGHYHLNEGHWQQGDHGS